MTKVESKAGSEPFGMPIEIKGLTDEDKELLRAFIAGSAWSAYQKLINDGLLSLYRQMEGCNSPQEMFRLQGRIQGLRYSMNAVVHLSTNSVDPKVKRLNERLEAQKPRNPRDPRLPA